VQDAGCTLTPRGLLLLPCLPCPRLPPPLVLVPTPPAVFMWLV
jgi:hypothetical protein